MADTGTIIKLHPPHNKGATHGSGMIVSDTNGDAYVFHTPNDNNNLPLDEGQKVNFELDDKGHITSVTLGRQS